MIVVVVFGTEEVVGGRAVGRRRRRWRWRWRRRDEGVLKYSPIEGAQ